jgi:hypothetical protein
MNDGTMTKLEGGNTASVYSEKASSPSKLRHFMNFFHRPRTHIPKSPQSEDRNIELTHRHDRHGPTRKTL